MFIAGGKDAKFKILRKEIYKFDIWPIIVLLKS